jgi:hypothetical protein
MIGGALPPVMNPIRGLVDLVGSSLIDPRFGCGLPE